MKSQRMSTVYFITHPDVVIDPATPVTQWPLSQRGRMRMVKMLENHWLSRVGAIYCSTEQKAIDGAAIISEALGIPYTTIPELGENDRSATGYLPEPEFDPVVDEFFRSPEESVRGWERGLDAQRRIIAGTKAVLRTKRVDNNVAIVGHGGTGTLLLCHLAGVPISRSWDQPRTNGGNYFAFDLLTFRLLHGWRSIDT
jgi:broad specificity phosphatase PhoE